MKILKKVGLVVLSLVVLVTVVSLFFPTSVIVERQTSIQAPANEVFNQVNTMGNWKNWGGPWHEEGMDFKKVIQGTEGPVSGVGSKLIYDQGKGNGSVEIIESEENTMAKTLITFADMGTANGTWTFNEENGATTVTWGLKVQLGYNPLMRIGGNLMFGGKVGPLFDKGLSNLKQVCEQ